MTSSIPTGIPNVEEKVTYMGQGPLEFVRQRTNLVFDVIIKNESWWSRRILRENRSGRHLGDISKSNHFIWSPGAVPAPRRPPQRMDIKTVTRPLSVFLSVGEERLCRLTDRPPPHFVRTLCPNMRMSVTVRHGTRLRVAVSDGTKTLQLKSLSTYNYPVCWSAQCTISQ